MTNQDAGSNRAFAIVLTANVTAQLALVMNGMAAAWSLTELTQSPVAIAFLNIATTLPTFLLALLAGALADVVSRRRIMWIGLVAQTIIVGLYALLALQGNHTVWTILLLATSLGIAGAITGPAWMATMPSLVPRKRLANAMNTSSAASNIAMAGGPAVAGVLVALQGPGAVFLLNVAILLVSLLVLRRYRPSERKRLPAEHLGSAIRMGLRYVRYDRPLKRIILKMVPYAFAAVSLMALMPAIARFQLGAGPAMFGVLAGAGGVGAILSLFVGPPIRRRFGPDAIVLATMLVQAAVLAIMAQTTDPRIAVAVLVVGGVALLLWVSSVMTALQAALPPWIRGRGVAVYLLALQGTFTLGALFWGFMAQTFTVPTALLAAAGTMAVASLLVWPIRLSQYIDMDTTPVPFLELPTSTTAEATEGPILVTASWQIRDDQRDAFLAAMRRVHRDLKRNGAISFHLVEDVNQPGHILESFTVATWTEFEAIRERTTVADKQTEQVLRDAAGGKLAPLIAHRVLRVRPE